MKVWKTRLEGVLILEPVVFTDARGYFLESYNQRLFAERELNFSFVQDNHSLSLAAGTIRGLHYQLPPMAQTKLLRVLTGAVYDVVVDIRKNSPTYSQWVGVILSADNHRQLLIPKGFAHGFCTLVPNTQVMYKVDEYYSPEHERGILWNDPDLAINWPVSHPILSEKDRHHPLLQDAEIFA